MPALGPFLAVRSTRLEPHFGHMVVELCLFFSDFTWSLVVIVLPETCLSILCTISLIEIGDSSLVLYLLIYLPNPALKTLSGILVLNLHSPTKYITVCITPSSIDKNSDNTFSCL